MLPVTVAMWLAGCATVVSDCPPLRHYDRDTQAAMADELLEIERRQLYPLTRRAMVDYAQLRALIRTCRGGGR